jgi:hypothetical protein
VAQGIERTSDGLDPGVKRKVYLCYAYPDESRARRLAELIIAENSGRFVISGDRWTGPGGPGVAVGRLNYRVALGKLHEFGLRTTGMAVDTRPRKATDSGPSNRL